MNSYDEFMNDASTAGESPAPAVLPEDEEKTPGALREDASKWDQFTDAQRKLIVFGVLLVVLLVLALIIGIGSSCGSGCGSCALCGSASSDSDVPPEDNGEIIVSDSETEDDRLIGSDSDVASPSDEDSVAEDTVVEDPADSTVAEPEDIAPPAVSGSDDAAADISGSDTQGDKQPNDGDVEYVEVVQPSGFSACVHHADNEAGDQSENTGSGFLGFLFGCGGGGCNLDVNSNLTDPVAGSDPSRQDGMATSGADADENLWPAQADDEAYLELLRTELTNISESMIQLSELDVALSQYTDPQRVQDNDRFRKITEEMLVWCDGAERYDAALLAGDQAKTCNQLSLRLAADLRTYLADYPMLITGATSGTDIVSMDQHINSIMGDIVELFAALNPSTVQAPEEQPAQ